MYEEKYSGYDDYDRIERKKKKDGKKQKKGLGATANPNLLDKYNGMEAKSNVNNSMIKALVDVAAGALVGPALSAALGKYAPIAGAALSFGGHYIGDQSGVLRGIGMSTIAHSVAKTKEYRDPDSTMSDRFSDLKDNWLRLVFMKKDEETPSLISGFESTPEIKPTIDLSNIPDFKTEQKEFEAYESSRELDLSALDQFDTQLEESANTYKDIHGMPDWLEDEEDDDEQEDFLSGNHDPELPDDFDFNLM